MNPRIALRTIFLLTAFAPFVPLMGANASIDKAKPLVLADKGRTDFVVLLPKDSSPTTELAASELQRYLGAISGARFDRVTEPAKRFILVCPREAVPKGMESPIAQMPSEGYYIAVDGGNLFLVGETARGTLYAVYDLLERLGCRWLAPAISFYDQAHEWVPKSERLTLSLSGAVIEHPAFKYRKLYVEEGKSHNLENLRQMVAWMPKRRFNTLVVPLNYGGRGRVLWDNWREALAPELRRHGITIEVGGHGYENFLNPEMEGGRLLETHPEWFGQDEKGRRSKNRRAVFCTSNQDARAYFIRNVGHYLDAHPEVEIFDFWPPDGAKWCQCKACVSMGTPSDRQAILLSQTTSAVRRAHPGLKFETIAYHDCVAPPAKATLDEGVLIDFCPIRQCFEFQIYDAESEVNAAYVGQLQSWLQSFQGDVSIYSYYRKYAWRSLPVLIPRYMQKDLQFYRKLGVRGISSYAEPGDWGSYELNHYVLGALAWNPDADVDSIIQEFSLARFGPEAGIARKACRILEENVRHVCSVPGTAPKTAEDYRRAADLFSALGKELDSACARSGQDAAGAGLRRLRLSLEYAQRDLSLQLGRAEHADDAQMKAMTEDLNRFLHTHARDGVFLTERIPAANR